MNSLLLYLSLQSLCLHLNAFDISDLSKSIACGTNGWKMVYRQTASNGGFPRGNWCYPNFCSYTPFFTSDYLKFDDLESYQISNGGWAFTMAWDRKYYIQWEQGENPLHVSSSSDSTWERSSYYSTFAQSELMNQYGRMDFNGLGKSDARGIAFDGGSEGGAYYAIGVSQDMDLMDFRDGIPGFLALSGFNYTAKKVELWVWKPDCGNWEERWEPSVSPTLVPTPIPTQNPTVVPTKQPTEHPTEVPTNAPTVNPTIAPTENPTLFPTAAPTQIPTLAPSAAPTMIPTESPTLTPTRYPTDIPTMVPTQNPTESPTNAPSPTPTNSPSRGPTRDPTYSPSPSPSVSPTSSPTNIPTELPSPSPTLSPSVTPTSNPSLSPTATPTSMPTLQPTSIPTANPTTASPTHIPTNKPTDYPTNDPTAPPTENPTMKPTQRPTSEYGGNPIVSVNTDREPVSLIIITSVALLLFIIFLMFTFWLCMTKRVPRFSVCDNARGKSRKKKLTKYISSESDRESDFSSPEKQTKRRNSPMELYVVTPAGESCSSVSEGNSLVEMNNGAQYYDNEQEQKVNSPKLIFSTIATKVITPDAYENSESTSQSYPIIDPSLVIQDSSRPQPSNISDQPFGSDVKNALSEYLTPRETSDFQEKEFCKARETRQVPNMELEKRDTRAIQNDRLSSSENNGSEGENSNSNSVVASLQKDLHPDHVSSHLGVGRILSGPQGERNAKSIEYAASPGEDIPQRKQTFGTGYLNNLRIGDSYNVEPLLVIGESTEENDIFGNDLKVSEAKSAEVTFDKVN